MVLQTKSGINSFPACAGSFLFGRGQLAVGTTLIKEDLRLRGPSLTQVNREGPQDQKLFQHIGTFVNSVLQKCTDVISALYIYIYTHAFLEVHSHSVFMGWCETTEMVKSIHFNAVAIEEITTSHYVYYCYYIIYLYSFIKVYL